MKLITGSKPETPAEIAPSWLVVRTKPQQERVAMLHLTQREVEPYCPMFQEPPWHKRAPKGPVPLFKGYIFVLFDEPKGINAIRFCPGVFAPLFFDGKPATVGQDLINALRLREGERGHIVTKEKEEGIPEGHKVRIMSGPLTDLEGIFSGYLRGGQRAKVFMEFIRGNKMMVELDTASLAIVNG